MKIKCLLLSLFVISCLSLKAQINFNYASVFPVTATSTTVTPRGQIKHAAVDPSGNIYLAGIFSNTIDADPSSTVLSLSTTGPLDDNMYILKLNQNGILLWAHKLGGNNTSEEISSITVDASGLYIAGSLFGSTIDMDPGPGFAYNSPNGTGFFAKYDLNGNFLFVKTIDESFTVTSACEKIVVDSLKNIYITGSADAASSGAGTIDVNPSSSAATTFTITTGHTRMFFCKYDSLGNFTWGKQIVGRYTYSQDLQIDKSGNLYISGVYGSTGNDFDPGTSLVLYETSNTTQTGNFFAKYDNSGNYIFAKNIRNTGVANATNAKSAIHSIRIGANKNIYLGGHFKGAPDFNPSSTVNAIITATGGAGGAHDGFIAKYDSAGNYQWVRTFGNTKDDVILGMDIDANDKLYYTGYFQDTTDFDPSPTNTKNISAPARVGFIGVMDSAGTFIFAEKFSDSTSAGRGLSVVNNELYLTGTATDIADFNFDPTTTNNVSLAAKTNMFLSKYQIISGPLGVDLLSFTGTNKEQENRLQWTTSQEKNSAYFNIEHSTDAMNFTQIGSVTTKASNGNSSTKLDYSFVHQNPFVGENYYRLQQVDANGAFAYSKSIVLNNAIRKAITIYPNPVHDKLFINSAKQNATYQIRNTMGQVVYSGVLLAAATIPVDQLEKGYYLLHIEGEVVKFYKD